MSEYDFTEDINDLRRNFNAGIIQSLEDRLEQLYQIEKLLVDNRKLIEKALYDDLHRHHHAAYMSEVMVAVKEVRTCCNELQSWMKSEKVRGGLLNILDTLEIQKDPLGVILVIGAWNYPWLLAIQPVIGAIAAGNCVVIKPSDLAAHTALLLQNLLPKYLKPGVIKVINGGIPETTALLKCRFDHILYTGGSIVAKIVMKAAAEHLTPVTLELGGKNPTIVDSTCDFELVGRRIAWGKFFNAGQTCVGVDYVLCIGGCQARLIETIKQAIVEFFTEDPFTSESYGRIINKHHYKRISEMIDDDKVVYGNDKNEEELYISPTILANVQIHDRIMQEEIFGPILAMLNVTSVDEAIKFVRSREKPLTFYVFSNDKTLCDKVQKQTSSGSFVVNDTLMQVIAPLPFGGVGFSGTGAYHDKFTFDCFSHKKSVLKVKQNLEKARDVRYPPYDSPGKELQIAQFEWVVLPSRKPKIKLNFFNYLLMSCTLIAGIAAVTKYFKNGFKYDF